MTRQRGIALLLFVVVLAAIGSAFILSASSLQAQNAVNRADADRDAYLVATERAIREWYRSNLATIDANVAPPATAAILNGSGVTRRYGLQVVASDRQIQGELGFRNIVVWIPRAQPDPSNMNAVTGVFTAGPQVVCRMISGAELQAEAISRTRATLSANASRLENYFVARSAWHGSSISTNYFRPDPICSSTSGDIPCLDIYTSATTVNWRDAGVDGFVQTDAWGNALEASNLADSTTVAPPYSMALRASTPWGVVLQTIAVQRL